MWELIGTALVAMLKWIFGAIAKKKLSDKEFIEYISAHQKRRGQAGQVALDWEEALKQAQKEMAEEEKVDTATDP